MQRFYGLPITGTINQETLQWVQIIVNISGASVLLHCVGYSSDDSGFKHIMNYIIKKIIDIWWTDWVSLCGCQGDEQTSLWCPRQVWPSAEDEPEEEEICRAGSQVGQVRSYLQVCYQILFYQKQLKCSFRVQPTFHFSLKNVFVLKKKILHLFKHWWPKIMSSENQFSYWCVNQTSHQTI